MNHTLQKLIKQKYGRQRYFIADAGLDACAISQIINGRRKPSADIKTRWAELLGTTIQELWGC